MSETATRTGFDAGALRLLPEAPAFVDALRRRALDEAAALPIPSQGTEEWRYTDLSGLDLDLAPWTPGGEAATLDDVPGDVLAAAGAVGDRSGMLIQRNSEVLAAHLDPALAADGVVFAGLDRAASERPDLVEPYLHALVPSSRTKFTALHAAFRAGGAFIHVPAGVRVELPLQALTYLDVDGAAVFPHTLLVVGEGAEVTFLDRYASPPVGRALSDAVVELVVGPAAHVRYVSIQDWGDGVTHLSVQRARVGRDAELRTTTVAFGASLSRTEAETVLAEPGGFSEMLGVYFADGQQHFDHRSLQDHVAPHCTSDLLYKGALRDESKAVYSGWVLVRPNAQKTDAMQTNRNVVLSERAKADSIPNLEIEANDVRCGHAASVGPVDEETLFYLMSRGISRGDAERLVVAGFFQEVLDRITLDEVRESVGAAIDDELGRTG